MAFYLLQHNKCIATIGFWMTGHRASKKNVLDVTVTIMMSVVAHKHDDAVAQLYHRTLRYIY